MKLIKNKIVILVCVCLLFVTGCSSKKNTNDKFTGKKEDFLGEHYRNFPDVKNIIYYLGLKQDNVTILSQTDQQLVFCFVVDTDLNVHDESIASYANYVKNLEFMGYRLTLFDATISSTFELENSKNSDSKISITLISDINEYKKSHSDIKNIDKLTNENILYVLKKK